MRICIILNPNAGSAEQAASLHEEVAKRSEVTLRETNRPDQAREFATEAVRAGYDLIVAAGGDGTINEVVNGLATNFAAARLGVIPLGTGNDLARTLAIPETPLEALELLTTGPERHLDLIKVEVAGREIVYCINIAAGGFSGQVDEVLTDELKASWGPLAYLRGAIGALPDLTGYETVITWDDGPTQRIEALNIIVANGRTAAGGFQVAPLANPEDGLLDVVIVRYGSLLDLAGVVARLLAANYLDSDQVLHRTARRVHIASHPGMWFNIDGELLCKEPITFSILPQALRVIAGPDYTPNPPAKG